MAEHWSILAFLLHLVVGLTVSSDIVLRKRDTRAALGWIGIVWSAPLVGTLIYFVFGVNRIHRRAVARRGQAAGLAESAAREGFGGARAPARWTPAPQRLATLARLVGEVTGRELCGGNSIEPLVGGDAAYPAMIEAIDSAEQSVALAAYIFDHDRAGRQFVAALSRAVQRGVAVRVLVDAVGARYSWPQITRLLRAEGVPWARFMPTALPWRFQYSNLRNHRKLLIVDGRVGFTGGMNIQADTLQEAPAGRRINDIHFRLRGPVVAHLLEAFVVDWYFAADETLEGDRWLAASDERGALYARGITDGPDIDFDKLRLILLGAINSAHESLVVVTPYFLPDESLVTALNLAALRGVEVDIILPRENNLRLMKWATAALLPQLLKGSCRVWMSAPPFDHSKLMIVDGQWSLIGSSNWDARSLRLNFEFNVEAYDAELGATLTGIARAKLVGARRVTLEGLANRPLACRVRDGFVRLASPYL